MRFGAILSVLSLGLVAIAAPTAYVQETAVARSAPVDLAVRDIVAPMASYEKRAESIVVARASVDNFMDTINSVKSELDNLAAPFSECSFLGPIVGRIGTESDFPLLVGQAQTRSVLDDSDWEGIFASITVQLNILVTLFADVSLLGLINIQVVASICASIFIVSTLHHIAKFPVVK